MKPLFYLCAILVLPACDSGRRTPASTADGGTPDALVDDAERPDSSCVPACDGRSCGPDPVCGASCGTCTGSCSSAGVCTPAAANAPRILRFDSDVSAASRSSVTFTAIVTDPDGIDNLIGGSLIDPVSGSSYGAFATSSSEGAYQLIVQWSQMNAVRAISIGLGTEDRIFRASFFDQEGHETQSEISIQLLPCAIGGRAALICNGVCVESDQTHCGACDDRCAPVSSGNACFDYSCHDATTLSVDSFTATVPSTPAQGWGDELVLQFDAQGQTDPSLEVTGGVEVIGTPWNASSTVTANASGAFTMHFEIRISEAAFYHHPVGAYTARLTAEVWSRVLSEEIAETASTTFTISSCGGDREWLACGAESTCDTPYINDYNCGACGNVCPSLEHVSTWGGGVTSWIEGRAYGLCEADASCAYSITFYPGSGGGVDCNDVCDRNSLTCVRSEGPGALSSSCSAATTTSNVACVCR